MKNFSEVVLFLCHFETGAEEIGLYYFATGVEVVGTGTDEALLFEDQPYHGVDGLDSNLFGVSILVVDTETIEVGEFFLPGDVD